LIRFFNRNWMYGHSMHSIYEKLKEQGYEASWEKEMTEIEEDDFQVTCHVPSREVETSWKNSVHVPHSTSEYFPYKDEPKLWPHQFERLFSVGWETDIRIRGHPVCQPKNVKMVGWPRGDILFNSEREAIEERMRESLNLPYEKTVLIICASFDHLEWEVPILNEIIPLSKGKFNVIIKDRAIRYTKMFSDRENISYVPYTADATPLYLVTDVLLSVHPASSTLIEVAQVNKPSITVNFWGEEGLNKWRYTFLGEADVVCRFEELNSNIMTLLEESEEYSPEIREKLKRFIYKPDGHATDRSVEVLKEMIG